jgi:hypothetical protein
MQWCAVLLFVAIVRTGSTDKSDPEGQGDSERRE